MMASPHRNDSRAASLWALWQDLGGKPLDRRILHKFVFDLKKSDFQRIFPLGSIRRNGIVAVWVKAFIWLVKSGFSFSLFRKDCLAIFPDSQESLCYRGR